MRERPKPSWDVGEFSHLWVRRVLEHQRQQLNPKTRNRLRHGFEPLVGSQSEGLAFCMCSGGAFGQERRARVLVAVGRAFQGSGKAEFQARGFNGAFHL